MRAFNLPAQIIAGGPQPFARVASCFALFQIGKHLPVNDLCVNSEQSYRQEGFSGLIVSPQMMLGQSEHRDYEHSHAEENKLRRAIVFQAQH